LLAIDRASVWRSPPLRRGLLVLAVLPVTAAVIASLPWSSIALLPPLLLRLLHQQLLYKL
jgi:hypothetical protein